VRASVALALPFVDLILAHEHPDLAPGHPHLAGSARHAHAYVIDDLHPHWPQPAR
jgi:hypothetical protein